MSFAATYGSADKRIDVSAKLRALFYAPTKMMIFIGKNTNFNRFFGDVSPKRLKTLHIIVTGGRSFHLNEQRDADFCFHFGANCDCKQMLYRSGICSQSFRSVLQNKVFEFDHGNEYLVDKIVSGEPFCAARLGYCEVNVIEKQDRNQAATNIGVSPPTDHEIACFTKEYNEALANSDCCFVFGRPFFEYYIDKIQPNVMQISANLTCEGLDKATVEQALGYQRFWFHALAGKHVLVVSPFRDSILEQQQKQLFVRPYPRFESLQVLQAPLTQSDPQQAYTGKPWSQHLAELKQKLATIEFDVALLGCGAYALPLAAECKQLGKQGIVLGGVVQVFFGVLGKRWEERMALDLLLLENWIRPSDDEKPAIWKAIEDGCYW